MLAQRFWTFSPRDGYSHAQTDTGKPSAERETMPDKNLLIQRTDNHQAEEAPLHDAVLAFRRYRYVLAVLTLALLSLCLGLAGLAYLLTPAEKTTTIDFRLDFEGAERGEYPNGSKFNSAEIISAPIIMHVYRLNQLEKYTTPRDFTSAVFLLESNRALEELSRTYGAKLADAKLNSVERDRLETEYRLKRESLAKSEFSINFAHRAGTEKIPSSLVRKSLYDILATWAQKAKDEKGVFRYRVPLVTSQSFSRHLAVGGDPLVETDSLRARARVLRQNIETLLKVPGASVVRTPSSALGLAEVGHQIDELLRFRIEPAIQTILSTGTPNPSMTRRYLAAQLEHMNARLSAQRAEEQALIRSMSAYRSSRDQDVVSQNDLPETKETASVSPQLGESFLKELIELATNSADLTYRQKQAENIEKAAIAAIPYEQEVTHYSRLVEAAAAVPTASSPNPAIQHELAAINSELKTAVTRVEELYQALSRNLNAASDIYTLSGPARTMRDRTLSLGRSLLYGFAAFLVLLPFLALGCWIAFKVRREELNIEAEERETVNA